MMHNLWTSNKRTSNRIIILNDIYFILLTVVLMSLPSSTGKRNFYPVNSCTEIKLKEIPIDVFQKCSETNSALHCLPDENNDLGLSCFQVTWISKGKPHVP